MPEISTMRDLEAFREKLQNYRKNFTSSIVLCAGTGCRASGSRPLIDAV